MVQRRELDLQHPLRLQPSGQLLRCCKFSPAIYPLLSTRANKRTQDTLDFSCTCQNGSAPGLQYYTQTMPTVRALVPHLLLKPLTSDITVRLPAGIPGLQRGQRWQRQGPGELHHQHPGPMRYPGPGHLQRDTLLERIFVVRDGLRYLWWRQLHCLLG